MQNNGMASLYLNYRIHCRSNPQTGYPQLLLNGFNMNIIQLDVFKERTICRGVRSFPRISSDDLREDKNLSSELMHEHDQY